MKTNPLPPKPKKIDLTQLQARIRALEQAENRLKRELEISQKEAAQYWAFIEKATDIIYRTDANGYLTYANPASERITGYTKEELVGHHYLELIQSDFRDEAARTYGKQFVYKISDTYFEFPLVAKDGREIWLGQHVQLLTNDDRVIGFQAIARDKTARKQAEEALRQSEDKFKLAFQTSPDAININRLADGLFVDINQGFTDLTGFTTEDVVGRTSLEINLWHDPADRERLVRDLREKGYSDNLEAQFRRKDGSLGTGLMSARILMLREVPHILSITRDITEHKRAEEALQASKQLLEMMFLSLHEAVFIINATNTEILDCNPAASEMFGYRREEMLGRTTAFLHVNEASLGDFRERLYPAVEEKGYLSLPEFKMKRKDGTIFLTEHSVTPLENKHGQRIAWVSVVRDITERKRAEEALSESEARFRDLAGLLPEIVFEIDQQGILTFANQNAFKGFGITSEDFAAGLNVLDMVTPEDQSRAQQNMQKILKVGDIGPNEYLMRRKDGGVFPSLVYSTTIIRDGKFVGLRGFIVDITERKRAEEEKRILEEHLQLAEKMEALGTMAGGVAHDLNNVLGIIVGYSDLLLHDVGASSPLRPRIVNILSGSQRAAAIVQDLLTLARRGIAGRKVLDLNNIIIDCQNSPEFMNLFSYHPSVKIKTDLEPDLLNISGSAIHLGKTIFNLVSNASEAMLKGGILTIKTFNQYLERPIQGYDEVKEGDYVVLSVSDTGEGIPSANLKRIFEPFYTKKVMGRSGTGLGLAVVWGTVKDHHGYINVQSEEGKGSTFTLYFPVTREEITAEDVTVSISEYIGKGETILVVDDVKGQRDLAEEMLKKLNYNTLSVTSGEEAVTYLEEHKVDLMVLDMIMFPGMDGLDTYKRVLEIHPQQKAIIVSGFSESDRVHSAQALGAGAYVKKPYIIEKLGLAVKKELDRAT